jgi:hypothetical protein
MSKEVFGVICQLLETNDWNIIIDNLKKGYALQMCFKNPGHYFSIIGFDNNELICIDSWPARTGSHTFILIQSDFLNIWPRMLVYN